MIDPDKEQAYSIGRDGVQIRVLDWEGNTVLVCGDERSAEHYAAMMNEAFRRGFKAGYRKAKRG